MKIPCKNQIVDLKVNSHYQGNYITVDVPIFLRLYPGTVVLIWVKSWMVQSYHLPYVMA